MKLLDLLKESQFEQMKVYDDLRVNAFTPIQDLQEDVVEEENGVVVGDYQTKHFDVCPGATALYQGIEDKVENMDLAERSAKLHDVLFFVEKHVQEDGYDADKFYGQVGEIIGHQIMKMAEMMGLEEEHQYIQGHIDLINKAVD